MPDEVSHFAYAQYLAETGRAAGPTGDLAYAREEAALLAATLFYRVVGDVAARPPWTEAEDARWTRSAAGRAASTQRLARTATQQPAALLRAPGLPVPPGARSG